LGSETNSQNRHASVNGLAYIRDLGGEPRCPIGLSYAHGTTHHYHTVRLFHAWQIFTAVRPNSPCCESSLHEHVSEYARWLAVGVLKDDDSHINLG
jgi:hypothetical protein